MPEKKTRILLAKPGLDGHDRGVKTVAYALKDAGFEVFYTGLHKTPDEIVALAIEKGAALIGLSILSGAHLPICAQVKAKLKERGVGHLPLIVGGVIPKGDIAKLEQLGIEGIFPVGSPFEAIVDFVKGKTHGG